MRYRVEREGFILGRVEGENVSEAQDRALDIYGLGATVNPTPIQNEPFDVDAIINNRDLSIRPIHRVLVVWGTTYTKMVENLNVALLTLTGKFIKDIQYSRAQSGSRVESCALIHYFDVAEVVTSKTLAQMMQSAEISPGDVELGIRLLGDLITNEALFEYANSLQVEWMRHPNHHQDRTNCIQAIRRFKGWI